MCTTIWYTIPRANSINIPNGSVVDLAVFSQYTLVTNGETDGPTERRRKATTYTIGATPPNNYDKDVVASKDF